MIGCFLRIRFIARYIQIIIISFGVKCRINTTQLKEYRNNKNVFKKRSKYNTNRKIFLKTLYNENMNVVKK